MTDIQNLAKQIAQTGRDEMAQVLADLLASPDADAGADGYRDGIEDALLALVRAGAADPRED